MSVTVLRNSASFEARAVALVIDFALLGTLHLCLHFFLAGRFAHNMILRGSLGLPISSLLYLIIFLGSFFLLHCTYFTIFHAWSGQTIGKMVLGIRVVTENNTPVSPAVAFLRWNGCLLSFVPFGAGFLWSAVDKDHCAWHDRLAQTRVVSAEMT